MAYRAQYSPYAAFVWWDANVPETSRFDELESSTREGAQGVYRFALYAGVGIVIGLLVTGLEWVTIEFVLHALLEAPLWVQLIAPTAGLIVTALVLRIGKDDNATSEVYVQTFHSGDELPLRRLGAKLTGALTTIGAGGDVGLEGPSVYAGSTIGQWFGRRNPKALGERSDRILLVAGAAAGVAAVFKAPATGVLFALESPYRRDLARHALIPSLIASAAAYLTFAVILGTEPLLDIGPTEVRYRDEILGAVVLGFAGGAVAHVMARMFKQAKHAPDHIVLWQRLVLAGLALASSLLAVNALVDSPATLGPGAELITEIVLDPEISLWAIAALFCLRAITTSATLGAGGVGGVFIPLVVQGLLMGRIVEGLFDAPSSGLYPVVGLAAVLGAGYRTPLAAVVFVAETTGRAEFVIPALVATAISQSLMGDVSVSDAQVNERQGRLERRLNLPALDVTLTGVGSVLPSASLLEVVDVYGSQTDVPAIPVADDDGYRGLLVLHDIATAMMTVGVEATAADAMRDVTPVRATEPAIVAARRMNETDTAAVPVVDDDDRPVGIVTALSLAGLRDL